MSDSKDENTSKGKGPAEENSEPKLPNEERSGQSSTDAVFDQQVQNSDSKLKAIFRSDMDVFDGMPGRSREKRAANFARDRRPIQELENMRPADVSDSEWLGTEEPSFEVEPSAKDTANSGEEPNPEDISKERPAPSTTEETETKPEPQQGGAGTPTGDRLLELFKSTGQYRSKKTTQVSPLSDSRWSQQTKQSEPQSGASPAPNTHYLNKIAHDLLFPKSVDPERQSESPEKPQVPRSVYSDMDEGALSRPASIRSDSTGFQSQMEYSPRKRKAAGDEDDDSKDGAKDGGR